MKSTNLLTSYDHFHGHPGSVCLDVFSISSTRFHVFIEGRMLAETKVRPIPESQQPRNRDCELRQEDSIGKARLEIRKDRKEEKEMEIEKGKQEENQYQWKGRTD